MIPSAGHVKAALWKTNSIRLKSSSEQKILFYFKVSDRSAVAESRRCVEAMEVDVTIEGQRAFIQLRRTLDDVRWRGENISVLGRVIVRPPYTPESADALQADSQAQSALMHVRKILSKPFIPEQRLTACCVAHEDNGGL
ncbi:unnamed protein product [Angiostrongylus costaricensis]|uniref:AD domain-containing protein n=1 Tax=Angiostrongylus costaricensis TaxID=334426 RepID=A0A0R3PJH0_ANGCS|nr:unnamed protein product [Angiostrongylus costaricensis]